MRTTHPGNVGSACQPLTVCGDRPIALINHTRPFITEYANRGKRTRWRVVHWDVLGHNSMRRISKSFDDEDEA